MWNRAIAHAFLVVKFDIMDIEDFKTLARPSSPNTYLVAPDGICANAVPDRLLEPFPLGHREMFALMLEVIEAETGWDVVKSDAARGSVSFISTSKLMRYKDDVDVLILPTDTEDTVCHLAIYSRSRVGYSDMGANRKRVLTMLERLNDRQKSV